MPDIHRCFPVVHNDKHGGNENEIATIGPDVGLQAEDCEEACLNNPACKSVSYVPDPNSTVCVLYDVKVPVALTAHPGGLHLERECPSGKFYYFFIQSCDDDIYIERIL